MIDKDFKKLTTIQKFPTSQKRRSSFMGNPPQPFSRFDSVSECDWCSDDQTLLDALGCGRETSPMELKTLFVLVVAYFAYLLIGAGVFNAIEGPMEVQHCRESKTALNTAISNLKFGNLTRNQLVNLIEVMMTYYDKGIPILQNVTCKTRNWDFQSAFFFSGTIVTTIGYGHITPTSTGSRAFCVIYALFGIPLFAIMFSGLSERFSLVLKKGTNKVDEKDMQPLMKHLLLFVVFSTVGFVLFCCIPAAIISVAEQWTFGDSLYYAIITLTTIGFGDFVVGDNPRIKYTPLYRVMVYFWILFGLAYMATVINFLTERFRQRGLMIKKKLGNYEDPDGENAEIAAAVADSPKNSISNGNHTNKEINSLNETTSLKSRESSNTGSPGTK
uniref:potassium channel subfamily K member 16 n=1 Tax=Ciona intestinalis TaxID=7719 RepID=UPI000180CCAC|nr:potassium channel subfamily K member 16 [Ciona intestinalis]|eukprot:XP_026692125.1 potassium channel subfamily K member 16 [Ciona intestinalis]